MPDTLPRKARNMATTALPVAKGSMGFERLVRERCDQAPSSTSRSKQTKLDVADEVIADRSVAATMPRDSWSEAATCDPAVPPLPEPATDPTHHGPAHPSRAGDVRFRVQSGKHVLGLTRFGHEHSRTSTRNPAIFHSISPGMGVHLE
jgi:hypothetical protein